MITIKKGLNIPLSGYPRQVIEYGPEVNEVAIVGDDYVGMKPTMEVAEGDLVRLGQVLFTDKKTPGVAYTSPAAGRVKAIHRGAKRKFESVVIERGAGGEETFVKTDDVHSVTSDTVRENLLRSGLWTALRTRPYSKVPAPESSPHSIFVTAIDTNPLAANPAPIIEEQREDFVWGLHILTKLTDGPVFVCTKPKADIPGQDVDRVSVVEFAGPHPAGLPGTHIHFLDPVSETKTVWQIGYQDAIAYGKLFRTGRLSVERVISLAGPAVQKPRLLRTCLGANIDELVERELNEGNNRIISGPLLSGRKIAPPTNYLGRYHQQVSVIPEGDQREFLGWQMPGLNKFSVTRAFAGFWCGGNKYQFTTSTGGSRRAMVPIGTYEKVMPLDIIPTFLLRALITEDTEQAQALGCLELDEEDLALCTFVCPGKYDYGPILRKSLTTIELEG